jgi:hypothetical protein
MKFLFMLRQFSGDDCRTVFNISDIYGCTQHLLFFCLLRCNYIYATISSSSLEELMITAEPEK